MTDKMNKRNIPPLRTMYLNPVANNEDWTKLSTGTCPFYVSPVFGQMDLKKLADFVVSHDFLKLRMGLQIHKFIWDPSARGV